MKLGFIDYYLDEWHANNYPKMIESASGGEMHVALAYGQIDSPIGGLTNSESILSRPFRRYFGMSPSEFLSGKGQDEEGTSF